jgi:hypothetical protein
MNLSFVDGRHGWLRVTSRLPGQRAEEETGTLLHTSDGGRTWERLPDAPTPGGIRFVTRQRGWQTWIDALWETRDGGRTWVAVPSLAAARGQGGRLEFAGLPTIFTNGAGFVPVLRYRRDPGLVLEGGFAETRDGGTTWSAPLLALGGSGNLPTMGRRRLRHSAGLLRRPADPRQQRRPRHHLDDPSLRSGRPRLHRDLRHDVPERHLRLAAQRLPRRVRPGLQLQGRRAQHLVCRPRMGGRLP